MMRGTDTGKYVKKIKMWLPHESGEPEVQVPPHPAAMFWSSPRVGR